MLPHLPLAAGFGSLQRLRYRWDDDPEKTREKEEAGLVVSQRVVGVRDGSCLRESRDANIQGIVTTVLKFLAALNATERSHLAPVLTPMVSWLHSIHHVALRLDIVGVADVGMVGVALCVLGGPAIPGGTWPGTHFDVEVATGCTVTPHHVARRWALLLLLRTILLVLLEEDDVDELLVTARVVAEDDDGLTTEVVIVDQGGGGETCFFHLVDADSGLQIHHRREGHRGLPLVPIAPRLWVRRRCEACLTQWSGTTTCPRCGGPTNSNNNQQRRRQHHLRIGLQYPLQSWITDCRPRSRCATR